VRRYIPRSKTGFSLPLALLALAVLLYAVYFSYLTIQRYHAFESRALDMGNLNQAIWNTAHGNWFRLTNQHPDITNRLSLHVEPILLLIAPLYRLVPRVETLLILQAVVVALGAIPLYALAVRQRLGAWLALAFGVAFLLNPTVQAANWLEFHPVTLVPTFLMAAFYFLIARRNGWFALFAVLAAACKEEIGLLVAMLGLYAWFAQGRRQFGLITFLLATGWSLFAVFGIQAIIAGGNIHWGRYAWLGETTAAKLWSLLTRPDLVLAQLQRAEPFRYAFELLLPVGFTALLAPKVLLLALPSLAINLLADFPPMHQVTTLIYAAPIVGYVMVAGVMGVARGERFFTAEAQRAQRAERTQSVQETAVEPKATTVVENPGQSAKSASSASHSSAFHSVAAVVVLGGALVSQVLYGYLPGAGNHLALEVTEHHRRAQAIIDQIPAGASVAAQDRLNPHVSGRETVYIFPRVDDADYIFLDAAGPAWPQHPNDLKRTVDELLAGDYGIAAADDGYLLLAKSAPDDTLPPSFYAAWTQSPSYPITQSPNHPITQSLLFSDTLQLLDYAVTTDRYGELVVDMTWQALKPIDGDLRLYLGYFDTELNPLHDSQFYQPAAVLWYPTSMWTPGEPVHVRSLPWTLAADRFALGIGVYDGEEGWNNGARLPITALEPAVPVLEQGTLARVNGYRRNGDGVWQPVGPAAPPQRTLDAGFGNAIRLDGVTLPGQAKAGDAVPFTLHWHATAPVTTDNSAFVHLLDAGGNKVAQLDWTPHDTISQLPTTSWPVDWPVADRQTLPLPPELAPGDYTLIAGLYDWQTGVRLPVTGRDAGAGDVAVLGPIRIE
jgi:uncharacterized membrane protein